MKISTCLRLCKQFLINVQTFLMSIRVINTIGTEYLQLSVSIFALLGSSSIDSYRELNSSAYLLVRLLLLSNSVFICFTVISRTSLSDFIFTSCLSCWLLRGREPPAQACRSAIFALASTLASSFAGA